MDPTPSVQFTPRSELNILTPQGSQGPFIVLEAFVQQNLYRVCLKALPEVNGIVYLTESNVESFIPASSCPAQQQLTTIWSTDYRPPASTTSTTTATPKTDNPQPFSNTKPASSYIRRLKYPRLEFNYRTTNDPIYSPSSTPIDPHATFSSTPSTTSS